MKRTISKRYRFGKVDFNGCGRKVNSVELEIGFAYLSGNDDAYMSVQGEVWNSKHTDILMGGQCLDELRKLPSVAGDPLFEEIYGLWKSWHLKWEREIPEHPHSRILSLIQG